MKQQAGSGSEPGLGSPPARGRGLKHYQIARAVKAFLVAPRAGAWIETA